ncbi:MAG TPA: TetR/AcrR family transcriptional regulator [Roseiflexaceae bacterium]|nr:TetR/AcrR family transcriptional regulator [Roseiflexaceae bacterium]
MTKGEETRRRIVARSAPVFNTRGYVGTSLADLTRATGLEKGGIYNHFASKEALALAAFDYAIAEIERRYVAALEGKQAASERLLAIIHTFAQQAEAPWLPGGCPISNTALEADDTSPALRERAQVAMTSWHRLIGATVKRGVLSGELRADADPYMVATVLSATLEGALMLSQLYGDPAYMRRAVAHLEEYVRSLAAPPAPEAAAGADEAIP